MDIKTLFNQDAIKSITDMLDKRCTDGARITRANLCQELGLTEALPEKPGKQLRLHNLTVEAVVGSIITLGVIPGFEPKKGPGGGLGKIGAEIPPGKKIKKAPKHREYPEGFLENMKSVLNRLCVGETRVSRKDIIKAMTLPEDMDMLEAMTLLSAAKACGDLPGFGSKVGVKGGFHRLPVEVEVTPTIQASTETNGATAIAEETTVIAETIEAAPVATETIEFIAEETPAPVAEIASEAETKKSKKNRNRK